MVKEFINFINTSGVNLDNDILFQPKSREYLYRELKEIYSNSIFKNKSTDVNILLGEWGSGKSQIINNLIPSYLEKKSVGYFVIKIDTVIAILDRYYKNKERPFVILGELFLYALLESILNDQNNKSQFSEMYEDISLLDINIDWIKQIIEYLEKKFDKVIIAIDEFEDIIPDKNIEIQSSKTTNAIIKGIKSFLNEDSFNKELQGFIQIIISCTPSAFYIIENLPDLVEIFGSLSRRINRYEINPLSKNESLDFLLKLINFSYNQVEGDFDFIQCPEGLLQSVIRCTLKNPGYIQSLFGNLQKAFNGKVITYKDLFNYLSLNKSKSNDKENYLKLKYFDNITQELDLNEKNLMKFFITSLKPQKLDGIEEIVENIDKNNIININLQLKSKIESKIILSFHRYKGDLTIIINEWFKKNGDIINKDNFELIYKYESFEMDEINFMDLLQYNGIKQGKSFDEYFFPSSTKDFSNMLDQEEEITSSIYNGIMEEINLNLDKEDYYLINPLLLNNFYPSTTPSELNFVENVEIREKTWREIKFHFKDNFERYFFLGLKKILSNTERLDNFKEITKDYDKLKDFEKIFQYFENKYFENKTPINLSIYHSYSELNSEDFKKIYENVKGWKDEGGFITNIILIFSNKILDKNIEKLESFQILEKYSQNNSLDIKFSVLPIEITQKICFIGKIEDSKISDLKIRVISDKYKIFLKNISKNINSIIEIDESYHNLQQKGFIIKDFSFGTNFSDFRYFISQIFCLSELKYDPESLFIQYRELSRLKVYSSKLKTITKADWTIGNFKEYLDILENNKFLIRDSNYFRLNCPLQSRNIYRIVKNNNNNIIIDDIEKLFIIDSKLDHKTIVSFYINFLELNGLLEFRNQNDNLKLIPFYELEKSYNRKLNNFKNSSKFNSLNFHIYIFKKKEENWICYKDFENILKKYDSLIKSSKNDVEKQKLYRFSLEIMEYFNSEILPTFENQERFYLNIIEDEDKLRESLEDLKDSYKSLSQIDEKFPEIKNIKEYKDLKNLIDETFKKFRKFLEKSGNRKKDNLIEFLNNELKLSDKELSELFYFKNFYNANYDSIGLGNIYLVYYQKKIKYRIDRLKSAKSQINQAKNKTSEFNKAYAILSKKINDKYNKIPINFYVKEKFRTNFIDKNIISSKLNLNFENLDSIEKIVTKIGEMDADLKYNIQIINKELNFYDETILIEKNFNQNMNLIEENKDILDIIFSPDFEIITKNYIFNTLSKSYIEFLSNIDDYRKEYFPSLEIKKMSQLLKERNNNFDLGFGKNFISRIKDGFKVIIKDYENVLEKTQEINSDFLDYKKKIDDFKKRISSSNNSWYSVSIIKKILSICMILKKLLNNIGKKTSIRDTLINSLSKDQKSYYNLDELLESVKNIINSNQILQKAIKFNDNRELRLYLEKNKVIFYSLNKK